MRSLIGTALLLCSDATQEETSLMQGLVARRGQLSPDAKEGRKDATAKLMETATKMLKNGATPDVITFIETTITEVNQNVLGAIVSEHHRDQQLIDDLLARFDAAIAAMEACAASIEQGRIDTETASEAHQVCRSDESLDCARSRRCEEELEELWEIVKIREGEMREIHWRIHGWWCEGPAPPHPGLDDPFRWNPTIAKEGPETSLSEGEYPTISYSQDVIDFRHFSVEQFGLYIHHKPLVEEAWENYNRKLLECAALEETWTLKVDDCDDKQDTLHDQACAHAGTNRQCASNFGHEYHMTMVAYEGAVETIQQLEYDRKREWETLHIVTCLLETVYTHVIHSIDSGDPCPTTESHPEQTEQEINYCHVVEESMTTNLTIDYGTPPLPPTLPPPPEPPCTAGFIAEQSTFSAAIESSHGEKIEAENLQAYFTMVSAYGWAGCAAPKACIPCEATDLVVDPAYVENEVCKEHHAHLGAGQMDWDTFKCVSGNECIRSTGRCNGVSNCDDASDELGCDTPWGTPAMLGTQTCDSTFNPDAQFQCGDGTCTHKAGRCNGINNCANGEDEEGCATTTTDLTVETMTGFTATILSPAVSTAVFYDRSYIFDSLGSFTGHSYVKISNEDKHIRHSHVQMKLRFDHPTIVYVAKLDDQELPWLHSEGWAHSSLIGVSYHGVRETRHTDWSNQLNEDHYGPGAVYQKTFPAGAVELRGNNGGDGSYIIFVANTQHPVVPPTPTVDLWQPVLGSEMGERVKCNDNVNLEYVADQEACQQLAVANGHPFYSFRHNGESQGHKCMSSAHCDDHMTGRTNEWHIYAAGGYHYGVVGGNTCESQDVSEAHCLAAVQSLLAEGVVQGRTTLVAGSWQHVPPGCSVQSHFSTAYQHWGDHAAHYNRNPSGQNDGGYTPVCVAGGAGSQGLAEYIGCFVDDNNRDLGDMVGVNSNAETNTFQLCRERCGSSTYMSLQFGGECFCANAFATDPVYEQRPDSECDGQNGIPLEPCASNSLNCGGTWRNAVYQIN
jgi:hypothetical protein